MSFEIFKIPDQRRRNMRGLLLKEMKDMFSQLSANPELTALSDVNRNTIVSYANKLGYKVHTSRADGKTLVWLAHPVIEQPEANTDLLKKATE